MTDPLINKPAQFVRGTADPAKAKSRLRHAPSPKVRDDVWRDENASGKRGALPRFLDRAGIDSVAADAERTMVHRQIALGTLADLDSGIRILMPMSVLVDLQEVVPVPHRVFPGDHREAPKTWGSIDDTAEQEPPQVTP